MTTKLQNLSKGYGYVDESNVIHKIDPKFLSTSIKLEIPADKIASILERLEDDGEIGAETLTSVILDGETKTIDADVCETIKTFAKANAIVFNFKDADGKGAAFAQCAYDIKSTGAEATAYFACDEMPYKLMFVLDETANTLLVAAVAKGETAGATIISLTFDVISDCAAYYSLAGGVITKLMVNGVETTLTSSLFTELLNKGKNGLLSIGVQGGITKPFIVGDAEIKYAFSIPAGDGPMRLVHCSIGKNADGTFRAAMSPDFGQAINLQLTTEDAEYFIDNDCIGEKEITSILDYSFKFNRTEITEGLLNLAYEAIASNSLAFCFNGSVGTGALSQNIYELEDGTSIDATIEFPSIDRAVDLIFDWEDMDSITVKMRKLSQSESSDYVFYAADSGTTAKYYKSYNDAISGGTEVTPDWAAIRTDILKNNANAKIKLLIEERNSTGDEFTVVRTYDCVGVRPADGLLEFRCIEILGENTYS